MKSAELFLFLTIFLLAPAAARCQTLLLPANYGAWTLFDEVHSDVSESWCAIITPNLYSIDPDELSKHLLAISTKLNGDTELVLRVPFDLNAQANKGDENFTVNFAFSNGSILTEPMIFNGTELVSHFDIKDKSNFLKSASTSKNVNVTIPNVGSEEVDTNNADLALKGLTSCSRNLAQ